jgi:hypothetical protein
MHEKPLTINQRPDPQDLNQRPDPQDFDPLWLAQLLKALS